MYYYCLNIHTFPFNIYIHACCNSFLSNYFDIYVYIFSKHLKNQGKYHSSFFLSLPSFVLSLFFPYCGGGCCSSRTDLFLRMQRFARIFIWAFLISLISFVFFALLWGFSSQKQPCLLLSITEVCTIFEPFFFLLINSGNLSFFVEIVYSVP